MKLKTILQVIAYIAIYFGPLGWVIYSNIAAPNKPSKFSNAVTTESDSETPQKREIGYQDSPLPQNDLMLNIVANPTFSLEDFVARGINKDNVSLKDIQVYRYDPYIRSVFTYELGHLDEMRLQSLYHRAAQWMKKLQNDNGQCDIELSSTSNDISAPTEQIIESATISQPSVQINSPQRTILQVTDVTTDRVVPSNNFDKTKAQTLGLLVRVDLFDKSIKLQFMDDNGSLIEEPMILDYQDYNYSYYYKYIHELLDGSKTVYEYSFEPTFSDGRIVQALLKVDVDYMEEARLTLRAY